MSILQETRARFAELDSKVTPKQQQENETHTELLDVYFSLSRDDQICSSYEMDQILSGGHPKKLKFVGEPALRKAYEKWRDSWLK